VTKYHKQHIKINYFIILLLFKSIVHTALFFVDNYPMSSFDDKEERGGGRGGGSDDNDMDYSELSNLSRKETPLLQVKTAKYFRSSKHVCNTIRKTGLTTRKVQTKLTTHKNSTSWCCKMVLPTFCVMYIFQDLARRWQEVSVLYEGGC
jgi:hypothetical protein